MLLRRIARPLLSAVFIGQGVETLRNPQNSADAAQPTLAALRSLPDPVGTKVPADPQTAARINAAVQVGGGLLLATGKMPRIASAALAFTVIPGSLGGHLFWTESDPQRKAQQRRDFLTDLSLLGGLIIASADTEGKPSLGWRGRRAAGRISEAVSGALPFGGSDNALVDSELGERLGDLGEKIGHSLQLGAERGRELAGVAAERSAPLVEAARERGAELAETARERGAELAEIARERGSEFAETARERGTELAETARKQAGVRRKRLPLRRGANRPAWREKLPLG
ncbi:DoxX family protein [Mycobacterium branderi]|uniref:DoxX family protein n=1 Tax=Mycobacterium branderi TaxID=43348 RepID=A0AA91LXQ3_9MYCO|nr:DoxX family protein [Mycobacterium branderi]MCV7231504.1 DoxX family membrane protein [Mycobacterium branderi]ORA37418.1 DoxX family protein [Mycobacterium branderi]